MELIHFEDFLYSLVREEKSGFDKISWGKENFCVDMHPNMNLHMKI